MAVFGGNRYLVPFNGGIATPVCGLVRNDRKSETHLFKQQFTEQLSKADMHISPNNMDDSDAVTGNTMRRR